MDFVERTFLDEDDQTEKTFRLRKPNREEVISIYNKLMLAANTQSQATDVDHTQDFLKLCVFPEGDDLKNLVNQYPGMVYNLPDILGEFVNYEFKIFEKTSATVTFLISSTEEVPELEKFEYSLKFYRLKNAAYLKIREAGLKAAVKKNMATIVDEQTRLHLHPESLKIAEEIFPKMPLLGVQLGGDLYNLAQPQYVAAKKK